MELTEHIIMQHKLCAFYRSAVIIDSITHARDQFSEMLCSHHVEQSWNQSWNGPWTVWISGRVGVFKNSIYNF